MLNACMAREEEVAALQRDAKVQQAELEGHVKEKSDIYQHLQVPWLLTSSMRWMLANMHLGVHGWRKGGNDDSVRACMHAAEHPGAGGLSQGSRRAPRRAGAHARAVA